MAQVPLTSRLEQAFATRIVELPTITRTVLLVAALNDSDSLSETLEAASGLVGRELTVEHVAPAVSAQLVAVDETGLRFRHPLVRTAIHQAASMSQRHAAHAALAAALAGQPDRSVWHRAASLIGPDEEVASELEAAATRARRRRGSSSPSLRLSARRSSPTRPRAAANGCCAPPCSRSSRAATT